MGLVECAGGSLEPVGESRSSDPSGRGPGGGSDAGGSLAADPVSCGSTSAACPSGRRLGRAKFNSVSTVRMAPPFLGLIRGIYRQTPLISSPRKVPKPPKIRSFGAEWICVYYTHKSLFFLLIGAAGDFFSFCTSFQSDFTVKKYFQMQTENQFSEIFSNLGGGI